MKRYINELTDEELKKVWDVNEKLQNQCYESIYKDNMDAQLNVANDLLATWTNSSYENGFEICDHYSSFFLRLRDGYKFVTRCNLKTMLDYNIITKEEFIEINNLIDKYENITPFTHENYQDVENEVLEQIDEKAKNILAKVEKFLHEYEDIDYSVAFEQWLEDCDTCFEDCYITGDDYKLYEDISYTKCYA